MADTRILLIQGHSDTCCRTFRAHSVKALERNILGFVGISPVRETLIGGVGDLNESDATPWLEMLRELVRAGQ